MKTKETAYLHKIELEKVDVFWNNDNLLKFVIKPGSHIELKDSKEMFEIVNKYSSGKKDMFVITIVPEECSYESEVREFSVSDECSRYTYAEAIVIRSLAHKILINFTLKFYKPKRLMKMFLTEEDAMSWLLSHKLNLDSCQN